MKNLIHLLKGMSIWAIIMIPIYMYSEKVTLLTFIVGVFLGFAGGYYWCVENKIEHD